MVMRNMESVGQPSGAWLGDGSSSDERSVVASIISEERYRDLDRKQSYFQCTQHDHKTVDFDGNRVSPGSAGATQPLLGSGQGGYVPLRQRRPSSPYRLSRAIVKAFTAMLLGDKRFPELLTPGDDKAEDYVKALSKACDLPSKMVHMRNLGGATGTACASWNFRKGRPRVQVHNAKNIRVHSWDDRDQYVPRHVTEAYKFQRLEYDAEVKRVRYVDYWFRRDWSLDWEVVFFPAKVEAGKDPLFVPDLAKSCEHKDGICHFVWVPNTPTEGEDGDPDYEGLYENFDTLDILSSVLARGGILNLDPTLVLKMDPDLVNMTGVEKGSEKALVVGEDGDADYMELAGTSIEAGVKLFNMKRSNTLEVASCVFPDPDKIAAAGTSSVALKMVFAQMLGQSDVLRGQYGPGIRRFLEPMLVVARQASRSTIVVFDALGNSREVKLVVDLPPKVVEDPDTGEVEVDELEPGESEHVETEWGEYFLPTPTDQQATVTTLSTAVGGQAFMSPQTATEIASATFGRDGGAEWRQLTKHQAAAQDQQEKMFNQTAATGGDLKHTMEMPTGAKMVRQQKAPQLPPAPDAGAPPDDAGGQVTVTPADASTIVTVNEARESMGLGKLQGPDGNLTLAAYKAQYATPIAVAANTALGKVGAAPAVPPAPPPGAGPLGFGGPPKGAPPAGPPKPSPPPGGAPPAPGAPPVGAPPAGPPKLPPPRPPMPHPLGGPGGIPPKPGGNKLPGG